MIFQKQKQFLAGKEIVFRSAKESDAELTLNGEIQMLQECSYLKYYSDEITRTVTEEAANIKKYEDSSQSLILLAFVDGSYAGKVSFHSVDFSRRNTHRVILSIGLLEKFTSFGLGTLLLKTALDCIKSQGFEQVELTLTAGNIRAIKLYTSFGFKECGRIPNAKKYDDGTYRDNILMVLQF